MWIPGCYYGTNYQSQGIDEWHTPFHPCVLLSDLLSTGGPLSINSNLNYALYSLTCLERVATSISQLKMLIFCIGALLYRLQLLCLGCYLFGHHFVLRTMPCQNVSYAHYQIPMKRTNQNYIKSMQLTFEV